MTRPTSHRTYQGHHERSKSGPGTFTCREDTDLVGRVITIKRRRARLELEAF